MQKKYDIRESFIDQMEPVIVIVVTVILGVIFSVIVMVSVVVSRQDKREKQYDKFLKEQEVANQKAAEEYKKKEQEEFNKMKQRIAQEQQQQQQQEQAANQATPQQENAAAVNSAAVLQIAQAQGQLNAESLKSLSDAMKLYIEYSQASGESLSQTLSESQLQMMQTIQSSAADRDKALQELIQANISTGDQMIQFLKANKEGGTTQRIIHEYTHLLNKQKKPQTNKKTQTRGIGGIVASSAA